ncbi:ABC transporter G family member 23-like [Tetranychus urticae]|uniref:ABC transporter domain-containing protein n=1 Tax=Tetranychus urticae TaxID=32264 RepID=T1KK19_TETUR|nr:ABC transporter G family member 23-like [Tetranychus urticae]
MEAKGSTVNAVESKNLYYAYTKGSSRVTALNHLTLTIPSGCIYCLIGPSGCGKTTFLKSLIGLIKVEFGSTLLYGYPLGHKHLLIPGSDLGYMPQEVALNDDLTIDEMLRYFVRLNKTISTTVRDKNIQQNAEPPINESIVSGDNFDKHLDSLSLPCKSTLISSLSGGQKRRVSFLCSLLNNPKLIILDEPTVGCDPLVICSMWDLLHKITASKQSTIIITTHYLEEARKTDVIGFMRKGQLLEHGTPDNVLNRLKVNSIEAAFAFMCLQYKKSKHKNPKQLKYSPSNCLPSTSKQKFDPPNDPPLKEANPNKTQKFSVNWFDLVIASICCIQLTYAVTNRLCLRLFKLKMVLLSSILVVPFLVLLTNIGIGGTPMVTLGLVNNEIDNPKGSDIFLNKISPHLVQFIAYNNSEAALHDSLVGKLDGYVMISSHFTSKLIDQYTFTEHFDTLASSNPLLTHSTSPVIYHGDSIRTVVVKTMTVILESAIDEALPSIFNASGLNPNLGKRFVVKVDPIAEPVSPDDMYNAYNFWMPKFLIFWSFVTIVMLSSFSFYRDRTESLFERNLSAGLTKTQFIFGHFLSSMIVPLLNSWPVLFITIHLLGAPCKGSLFLSWLIYMSNGATAVATSLALAAVDVTIGFIYILISAYIFSGIATAGILWPYQALPYFVKPYISIFPFTFNIDSMIRVLAHGATWEDSVIRRGLLENFIYICLVLTLVRIRLH